MNYLQWVDGNKRIVDFVEEAVHLGVSKKLPFLPRHLNKGSKIYLASLQITHYRNEEGKRRHKNTPVIFGHFIVDHIEFIVDEFNPKLDEIFKAKGLAFCQVTKAQARKEPARIDGKRLTAGAIFAVNTPPDVPDSRVKARQGMLAVYNPFVGIHGGLKFFRGIKEFELQQYLKFLKNTEVTNL